MSERRRAAAEWWPLVALTLLAAALRLSTLGLQGLWYDEAFTPVHVLHPGLSATLHAVVHTENTPPLWYLLEWLDSRILGTGAIALRLPSALAGIATVPVAWAIGLQAAAGVGRPAPARSARRAAIACAALVAVNPLFVWYSQEARAYGLYMLAAALLLLSFLRLRATPSTRRGVEFALAGSLAMLTHYFAVFLLAPMALMLLLERPTAFAAGEAAPAGEDMASAGEDMGPAGEDTASAAAGRRVALAALAVQGAVGLALIPLIAAQGGHGTQWIGRWPLGERLAAIPQYFLLGPSGEPLGHGIELLVALAACAGVFAGLWYLLARVDPDSRAELLGARALALVAAGGVLVPLALALGGADYLAPRNLVGAMVAVIALVALLSVTPAAGRLGVALLIATAVGFLAIVIDVDLSPRLQRGDWRGVARQLKPAPAGRAIVTVELGAAPLEYYVPGLSNLARGRSVSLSEIDETGYAPLRAGAQRPPAPGFRLLARRNVHGLVVLRFGSSAPVRVAESTLRRSVITAHTHPEVLIPHAAHTRPRSY